MKNYAVIKELGVYLPENKITNKDIVQNIHYENSEFTNGVLERVLGSNTRYFANRETQVSDLACEAARKILKDKAETKIDLLIFAAASSDLIEPATANIIQSKLDIACAVMDIKNACNSFVTAIHTASAFIEAGYYNQVLIVNGEKLSEVINYYPKNNEHLIRCIPAYSLGDAGAAMLLGKGEGSKILYQHFASWGENWDLCTVEGGGSRAFREADKYYFESDAAALKDVFISKLDTFVKHALSEAKYQISNFDCVITHQVSSSTISQIAEILHIPKEKCIQTFEFFGNTAAASIPLALDYALKEGRLKKGDKLLLIGLAAGISLSVQIIEW